MPKKWIKIYYIQFNFVARGKYFVVIFDRFSKYRHFSGNLVGWIPCPIGNQFLIMEGSFEKQSNFSPKICLRV